MSAAFRARGHEAWSCDLLPTEGDAPEFHVCADVGSLMSMTSEWDLVIAHPPCTFLTVAAARWFYHPEDPSLPHPAYPNRRADQDEAAAFFMSFVEYFNAGHARHMVIENPVGVMSTRYRKPDQIVQPYNYGHDASKSTCLWLLGGLPKLTGTKFVEPRITATGAKRWANQAEVCGSDVRGRHPDRWKLRSTTYIGIAEAMAEQWGEIL